MTYWKILAKGKKVAPELTGHPGRILSALMAGDKDYEQLVKVVKPHCDGDAKSNCSWWLSNMCKCGYISKYIEQE